MKKRRKCKINLSLTVRQQAIYDYIKKYIKENGYGPTIREIGNAVGLSSTASVHSLICSLKEKGYIEYGRTGSSRTLHLTNKNALSDKEQEYSLSVPAPLGTVVWVLEGEMAFPYVVNSYLIKEQETVIHLKSDDQTRNYSMTAFPANFGQTVFFSQKAAAEKLMEMKEEHDFED